MSVFYICNMEIGARIKMIIESHRLTAGAFADRIGVQRSNVSHVLSGRNKPSYEFLEKVLLAFPKVSAAWLITGKQEQSDTISVSQDLAKQKQNQPGSVRETVMQESKSRFLVKTILCYNDNTCEEYLINQQ